MMASRMMPEYDLRQLVSNFFQPPTPNRINDDKIRVIGNKSQNLLRDITVEGILNHTS